MSSSTRRIVFMGGGSSDIPSMPNTFHPILLERGRAISVTLLVAFKVFCFHGKSYQRMSYNPSFDLRYGESVRLVGGLIKHVFSACLRKLQAATMLCQQIDPLAGAFYQKRRPRLPGMQQSLLRLLIFTFHLIRVRCGIMFHSIHLNPIHRSLADCPGQAFSFFLVHGTPLAYGEPVLLMRVLLTVLKNLQDSALKYYILCSGSSGRVGSHNISWTLYIFTIPHRIMNILQMMPFWFHCSSAAITNVLKKACFFLLHHP